MQLGKQLSIQCILYIRHVEWSKVYASSLCLMHENVLVYSNIIITFVFILQLERKMKVIYFEVCKYVASHTSVANLLNRNDWSVNAQSACNFSIMVNFFTYKNKQTNVNTHKYTSVVGRISIQKNKDLCHGYRHVHASRIRTPIWKSEKATKNMKAP